MAKISVIVPIYNVEKYLKECLDSIVNQTFQDIEIILINDGSTDNSLQIIEEYSKLDSRIIIINQENMGQGEARNNGIKKATAPYLAFIDSDDFVHQEMLEKLYTKSLDDNSDIVKCRYSRVLENSEYTFIKSKILNCKNKEDFFKEYLSINHLSLIWDGLYKKDLFINNDIFFKGIVYEDTELIFKLIFYGNKISKIDDILYYWRKSNNSTSRSISKKQIDNIFKVFNSTYLFLKEKRVYKQYKIEFLQRCFYYHNRFIDKIKDYSNNRNKRRLLKYFNKKVLKSNYLNKKNKLVIKDYNKNLYIKYLEKKAYLESFSKEKDEALIYKLKIENIKQLLKIETLLEEKEKYYALKSEEITQLKDKFKNKSCILIGKGPSYNAFDKTLLKDKFTIIFSDILETEYKPTFYIEEEDLVIKKYLKDFNKSSPAKYNFLPNKYKKEIKKNNFYFFNQDFSYHKFLNKNFLKNKFSKTLDKKIYSTSSSMYLCLQLAYYLGFTKIYLLGIDLNYEQKNLSIQRDNTNKGINKIIKDFKYAKKIFEKDNKEILNLSKESILKMFKYVETID